MGVYSSRNLRSVLGIDFLTLVELEGLDCVVQTM